LQGLENLHQINIHSISDLDQAKVILNLLLNAIETLTKENKAQQQTIQELRDEINRLKGEHGKPNIKANTKQAVNISSTKETQEPKQWQKTGKKDIIKIDKTVNCPVDKNILPSDAQYKGTERIVEQHIIFKRENTEYMVEIFYSPSEKKTYRGKMPDSYNGGFSNDLRAFSILAHHTLDIPRNKLLALYSSIGIEMSDGSLNNILQANSQKWIDEKSDLLKEGLLGSGGVAQTDITGARVKGQNHYSHIICGENFTVYSTLAGKSRLDVMNAFQGEPEYGISYQYNSHTLRLLDHYNISRRDKQALSEIYTDGQIVLEAAFVNTIKETIPELFAKKNMFKRVCDAFALAYFYELGILKILVSDDAKEYELIAALRMLCWIHDGRHYKKLNPNFDCHQKTLTNFLERYWDYYHRLLAYTKNSLPELMAVLEKEFDELFTPTTDYTDLNNEIKRTLNNKEKLLTVLQYPTLPLHNNRSELAARKQVRKRDISLHTMTPLGTKLQDAFMSISQTCIQLNVDVWEYIRNRFNNTDKMYLPNMVSAKYNSS
jgi:Transposase IS66 family